MVTTKPKRFSQKRDKYRGRAKSKILFSRVFFVVILLFHSNTYGVILMLYKYHHIYIKPITPDCMLGDIPRPTTIIERKGGGRWKGALFDKFLNRSVSPAKLSLPQCSLCAPGRAWWPPAWRPGARDRAAQLSRRRSPHCPPPATTPPPRPAPLAVAIQPLYSVQAPRIVRLSINEPMATHRRGHVGSPRKAL